MASRITNIFGRTIALTVIIFLISACNQKSKEETLFTEMFSNKTGVDFSNQLTEDDRFNIIEYLYFYNGAGVAIGDINNDGLPDLYFSSNQSANKLYLNKGDFRFEDISAKAKVEGLGNWKTGVTMVDINGDGLLDIFSCGVGGYKEFTGQNQLLLNNGDLTFTDKTTEYGLSFQGFSTQAAFFDYDNDGDLDMYLLNHSVHSVRSYGDTLLRYQSDPKAGDKLYRNEFIPNGESKFIEMTSQAEIFNSQIGYGLGIGVSDFNNDGYLDIYVSNDFHENDYLYLNQQDGTFKQQLKESIPHTSRFSMGSDVGDVNNDGWQDIITLDMLPKNEQVLKASGGEDPYEIFDYKLRFGYHYQAARNALQLNKGAWKDRLLFSDIAALAGVEATDWSWGPLLADFDNDGFRDLFVANGIVRRPNDLDYINYISSDSAQRYLSAQQMIDKMPSGKVANLFFKNNGDLTFEDVSQKWASFKPTISNGAAYADLDNDGDLDLVVNNTNEKASIYRNDLLQSNFLKVKLTGVNQNKFGIGARVIVYAGDLKMVQEQIPTRGWQSASDCILHFGLGKNKVIDSVIVFWPDNTREKISALKPNEVLNVNQLNATSAKLLKTEKPGLLKEVDLIDFTHEENTFSGFEVERLIPHSLATAGPRLAIGDVNNDKLDDVFVCGGKDQQGELFLQNRIGDFIKSSQKDLALDSVFEDIASAFIDVDGDGDLDLVIVSGGAESALPSEPRLYLNSNGKFKKLPSSFPKVNIQGSCIAPSDIDGDGDVDLFIGARMVTGHYGLTPDSYLFINDGSGHFSNETSLILDSKIGMVTDALWSDLNYDGKPDLIVVGEWMPITIFIQEKSGSFINQTEKFGLDHTAGWWNTIKQADLDGDGDLDFLVGNVGTNIRLRPSVEEPVELWVSDIDGNGSTDPIITYYNDNKKYPFISKDQLLKQLPHLKKKFVKYSDYVNVTLNDIVPLEKQVEIDHKRAEVFSSIWIENDSRKLVVHKLANEAQMFPIFAFEVMDINNDTIPDVFCVGNWFEVQPELGRMDAGYGLIMMGTPEKKLKPISLNESSFVVTGQGRDIAIAKSVNGNIILITRNNNRVLTFMVR